jgi:hypothetical protein
MKSFIILIFVLTSTLSFGQPNPQDRYPERIKAITEQLKTDSLNYEIIWERLAMKVNLMGGFGTQDEIFALKVDPVTKNKRRELYFDEFNADFDKIYKKVIKEKRYNIVEENVFYQNRIWFYFNLLEIDKAIQDAKYLRDSVSNSIFRQTGDYYYNSALYSLFNLYVINNQYKEALETIDTMLEKKKKENEDVYFSGHGSFLSLDDKIKLFEHFNDTGKIIPFLKENCIEHFNWYFQNSKKNDYYTQTAKQHSFELLKLTINYMRKYKDKELLRYQNIYEQLIGQVNANYQTINPDISDSELKSILSKIY